MRRATESNDAREAGRPPRRLGHSALNSSINETLRDLPKISDAIAASYFAHSTIFPNRPGKRAMRYHIVHRTLYEYAAPVTVSHHVARLEPRATATQTCG